VNIPELFSTLSNRGFRLELDGDDLKVSGIERMSNAEHQALKANKSEIVSLLSAVQRPPLEPTEEEIERVAIKWADTVKDFDLSEEIGNDLIELAAQDYRAWFEKRIGKIETLESLEAFSPKFEQDIIEFAVFRLIADNVRQLMSNRRALLKERERDNQKTSDPDATTLGSL
jgi:hypothetical protein